jgi:haloalkane dehalogenase
MEFIRPFPAWDDLGRGDTQEIFKQFRDPSAGRKLVIEDNLFIQAILPGGVVRKLSEAEQAYYEAPFPDAKSREPVYRWPNEIPIEVRWVWARILDIC